jgi:hypothetical protein
VQTGQHRNGNDLITVAAAGGWRADAFWLACAVTVLLALALMFAAPVHATTYKWVDEKGIVHYTDKIPPEAINKGNVELNKQGLPIKKTDPALTPEQQKARAAEEARAQQIAKDRELVERRDRALLATYTTESEIDLARNRAVSTIDAQVQSSTAYSAMLNKRKLELDGKKAALGDKPIPPVLEREAANIDDELAKQADLISAKQKEMIIVNARYDADKRRWKELRAVTEAAMNGAPNVVPTTARQ